MSDIKLVLASTSPYRKSLLQQLGLEFDQVDPGIEEIELPGEPPEPRALRLAQEKAQAAANIYATGKPCIVIGSDQVAHMDLVVLHKPGNFDLALQQLIHTSGRWVSFSAAICLCSETGEVLARELDTYEIKYRQLDENEIQHYLKMDTPYDCAGSIKAEGRGIALIEDSRGKDINTLYGLPLILLVELLSSQGFNVIKSSI